MVEGWTRYWFTCDSDWGGGSHMYADDVVSMDCDSKPYPEDVWVSGGGHAGSVPKCIEDWGVFLQSAINFLKEPASSSNSLSASPKRLCWPLVKAWLNSSTLFASRPCFTCMSSANCIRLLKCCDMPAPNEWPQEDIPRVGSCGAILKKSLSPSELLTSVW